MTMYFEHGGKLSEMTKQDYAAEDMLQRLIARHPALLAGDEGPDERNQWVLSSAKLSSPIVRKDPAAGAWTTYSLIRRRSDARRGERSSDTRIGREVIGQMLEYAANGPRYWPIDSLRAQFAARCAKHGPEADEVLRDAFGGDLDVDAWWTSVATNLREGTLRLLCSLGPRHRARRRPG